MHDSFEVVSSSENYFVVSGTGLVAEEIAGIPNAVFIVDAGIASQLPDSVTPRICITSNEFSKSLEHLPEIIGKLRAHGTSRNSHLIAIGGGTIQDIATFIASVYMRGIRWTYMPTTLLAMADSCIGGKSSINVLGHKNLVGNIYPPAQVLIDLGFTESLNSAQMVAGLCEAVKISYARGRQPFLDYLADAPTASMAPAKIQRIIMRSLRAKKWFIEIDEFDQNERLLLNFGHSFGHALEAGTAFVVPHGIAVGIGMLVAIEYAQMRNWLSQEGLNITMRLKSHIHSLLGESEKHITAIPPPVNLGLIMRKLEGDKKHLPDAYRIVVPKIDGSLALVSEPRSKAVRSNIADAYENVLLETGWDIDPENHFVGD